jgi:hypothetical protein
MVRPKYPPTRRKTFKLDSLQPLPIDWSSHDNRSAPTTPLKSAPAHFFPTHESRLSRCISLKVGNNTQRAARPRPRIIVDKSKRRASLQVSHLFYRTL